MCSPTVASVEAVRGTAQPIFTERVPAFLVPARCAVRIGSSDLQCCATVILTSQYSNAVVRELNNTINSSKLHCFYTRQFWSAGVGAGQCIGRRPFNR